MKTRLVASIIAALLVTGCANPDPRISASQTPWPRSDLFGQAATAEYFLAGVYGVADSANLPGCGTWCAAAQAMHQAQATVLTQPDPWGGFTEPTMSVLPDYGSQAAMLADLERAANDALTAAQAGLAAAGTGPEALLWASLVATANASVTFASDQTAAMPELQPGTVVPSQIDVGTSADAAGTAMENANAVIYVATVGAAQATTSGGLKASLGDAISQAKADRTILVAQVTTAGATVPAPQLSYPMSAGVGSDDAVRASLAPYQSGLGNGLVRLAGTMTGQDAVGIALRADFTGGTLTWWPGWG